MACIADTQYTWVHSMTMFGIAGLSLNLCLGTWKIIWYSVFSNFEISALLFLPSTNSSCVRTFMHSSPYLLLSNVSEPVSFLVWIKMHPIKCILGEAAFSCAAVLQWYDGWVHNMTLAPTYTLTDPYSYLEINTVPSSGRSVALLPPASL